MYFLLFIIISVFLFGLSRAIFNKIVNPCSVYITIWCVVLTLYKMNLIYYDRLINKTNIIIIVYEISIVFGIIFGSKIKHKNNRLENYKNDNKIDCRLLNRYIYITSFLAAIAIVPNTLLTISKYGFIGMFTNISKIYRDRLIGEEFRIGYFSPMIFICLILVAIRIKKDGLKKYDLIVVILAALNAVTFGGRNNMVYTIIFILTPLLVDVKIKAGLELEEIKSLNKNRKRIYRSIILLLVVGVPVFYIINMQRALATVIPKNISPILQTLVAKNYSIYRTLLYITVPVAYMNNYLKNSYFMFGVNTFNFLYKELNHLGFNIPRMETLPFYNVPMSSNVGTYITELTIDFSVFGPLVIFLLGAIFGYYYSVYRRNNMNIWAAIIMSTGYVTVILSFFMWQIRSTTICLVIIYGFIISVFFNRKLKIEYMKKMEKDKE